LFSKQIKHHFQREKNASKGFSFLVATDGSEKSLKGLDVVKMLIKSPNDLIYTVYISDMNMEIQNEVMAKIEARVSHLGIKVKSFCLDLLPNEKIESKLMNFANDFESTPFDFLVIGNTGTTAQSLGGINIGRTADYVMRRSLVNLLLIK
jgi:nucleotide-binding universal stress UspA family protein